MKMMNYDQFRQMIREEILSHLPEEYQDAEVRIEHVSKLGHSYEGMSVLRNGKHSAAVVNLEELYSKYQDKPVKDWILANVAEIVQEYDGIHFMNPAIPAYDEIRDRLFIRLTNIRNNESVLENVPHQTVDDLAVTYHVRVDGPDADNFYSYMIQNSLLDHFGISPEQLHRDALDSSMKMLPPTLRDMKETLIGLGAMPDSPFETKMYVLSNELGWDGAAAMMYDDVKETAAKILQGNFVALPSSIHEFILIKDDGELDYETLRQMVRDVNQNVVNDWDWLSDNIYRYDAQKQTFSMIPSAQQEFEKQLQAEAAALKPVLF